jgi:hypothetical protein
VETTGAYNATSNLTGWGAPNDTLASATSAELQITLASGNIYTIDLLATTYFPTDDTTFEYALANSDFGYTDDSKIDDQIIDFKYTVVANGTTYTQNIKQAFYCQVQCCVKSMVADIDVECDCAKDKMDNYLKAKVLLDGLIYNANCGNVIYFNNILTQLQKLCLNNNCQNCK